MPGVAFSKGIILLIMVGMYPQLSLNRANPVEPHLSVDLFHCEPPTQLDKTPFVIQPPKLADVQNPTE